MKFDINTTPNSLDIEYLTEKINQESPEFGSAYNFGLFVHDEDNRIIGGGNGSVVFGAIYTDQLWVDKKYRGTGLARKIMEKVHDYGRENGCKMATVTTMNFQNARNFYEKLGYTIDFERNGYTMGSSMIFLKKSL
jgi:GNAT superfamily N-acetyltransferase